MRWPGRVLGADEIPPRAMLRYIADQVGADPEAFALYARREETRRDHTARLMVYLDTRSATAQDRRVALLAAIQTAAISDDGPAIASSIVTTLRERGSLLPAIDTIERIGLAGSAIARRRAERTLIEDIPLDTLQSLVKLLEVDQSIGQTRFHWLRSAPEAPGASNLVGLTERIAFLRTLEIDPKLQMRISSGRWDQMIREGNATPAWLASDFNSSRRQALIVAQVIKLGQKLTDDAVGMFIKLMGRPSSQANNRKKQRHMDCRPDTANTKRPRSPRPVRIGPPPSAAGTFGSLTIGDVRRRGSTRSFQRYGGHGSDAPTQCPWAARPLCRGQWKIPHEVHH